MLIKRVCYLVCWIYFAVMCLFVGLRICSNFGLFSFLGDWQGLVLSLVTQVLLIGLIPILTFKKKANPTKEGFKSFFMLRKMPWTVILISIGLGVVVFILNMYVSTFFNTLIGAFGYTSASTSSSGVMSWGTFILTLFTTAVLPAIFEELLHRGMLFTGLQKNFGVNKAIVWSGLLFGLLHMNIEQVFFACIVGVFLSFLCGACGSVYPCMIVHFMNNALCVTDSFLRSRSINMFGSLTKFVLSNHMVGVLLLIVILIVVLILAFFLTDGAMKESFRFRLVEKQKAMSRNTMRDNFFSEVERIKQTEDGLMKAANEDEEIGIFIDRLREKVMEVRRKVPEPIYKPVKKSEKIDLKIRILLIGCFVLGIVMTLMTFIWGILR